MAMRTAQGPACNGAGDPTPVDRSVDASRGACEPATIPRAGNLSSDTRAGLSPAVRAVGPTADETGPALRPAPERNRSAVVHGTTAFCARAA